MVAGYQTYYSSTGGSSSHHNEQTALLTGQPSITANQYDKDWNSFIRCKSMDATASYTMVD